MILDLQYSVRLIPIFLMKTFQRFIPLMSSISSTDCVGCPVFQMMVKFDCLYARYKVYHIMHHVFHMHSCTCSILHMLLLQNFLLSVSLYRLSDHFKVLIINLLFNNRWSFYALKMAHNIYNICTQYVLYAIHVDLRTKDKI